MKKQAFTLAEVLITLVIIGVIAALTIPTLMNNMKDEANIVALKKFYSETNQILQKVAIEDCGTPGSIAGCFTTEPAIAQAIAKYYKKAKDCAFNNEICWSIINSNFDGTGDDYNMDTAYAIDYRFITLDGMSVKISIDTPNCSAAWNANPDSPLHRRCGSITVDINGDKSPNRFGKDVFGFSITSNKAPLIYPQGGKDLFPWVDNGCTKSNPIGTYCAGRFIENGWKADYSDAP